MNHWIANSTKKSFLESFIKNYRFRSPEARRILELIMSSTPLLQNLYFTEKLHPYERNLVISTTCADNQVPFKYLKGTSSSSYSVAEATHDLAMNPKAKVYLLLHFRGKQLNYKYQELIKGPTAEAKEAADIKKWSELVIERSLLEGRVKELAILIDQALANGDKELFMRYTNETRSIQESLREE